MVRCGNCKEYVPKEEAVQVGIQNFCDSACQTTYRYKKPKEPKKAFQKKKRLQQDHEYAKNRKLVLERDRFCRVCGGKENLQAHHVMFRSQAGANHQQSNLILLCNECHATYAHGPEAKKYRNLFRAYIWLRMVENRCVNMLIPGVEKMISLS